MKAMILGSVALALALAGCGGKESYTINGGITGLQYDGLVLGNGSDSVAVPAKATSYQFPQSIGYGNEYNIVFTKQPAHQTCGLNTTTSLSLSGSAGRTEKINVDIVCVLTPHSLSGTVSGLTVDGLTIVNGNGTIQTIAKDATTFTYPDAILSQSAYGLVIKDQPATGVVCSLANGVGTMQDADITNVAITCVPK